MFYEWRKQDESDDWWQGDSVTRIGHHEWFAARVANPLVQLYVAEIGGEAVGQVRVDSNGEISFSVDVERRGEGNASQMLRLAAGQSQWHRLKASVDATNEGGIKALQNAGFTTKDVVFLRWP